MQQLRIAVLWAVAGLWLLPAAALACPLEPSEPSCLRSGRPFIAKEREDCRRQVERFIERNDKYRACLRAEEQSAAERAQDALIRLECKSAGKTGC